VVADVGQDMQPLDVGKSKTCELP